jgi:2-polyprenyl-6-methoxyphenol hydroxylase-like FAD-dependent oxidoreductase
MASITPIDSTHIDGIMPSSPASITLETDLLIVGAGPAGASLACFLARYGLKGLMISSAPGTADTPRAHMNNMAALECLRDIGLWEECKKLGHAGNYIKHFRCVETLYHIPTLRTHVCANVNIAGGLSLCPAKNTQGSLVGERGLGKASTRL